MIDEEKRKFKAMVLHEPYFYLVPYDNTVGGGEAASAFGGSYGASPTKARKKRSKADEDAAANLELQSSYQEIVTALLRLHQPKGLNRIEIVRKMDLDDPNHLGVQSQTLGGRRMLKIFFDNIDQLQRIKKDCLDTVRTNQRRKKERDGAGGMDALPGGGMVMYDPNYDHASAMAASAAAVDPLECVIDIREHDVPYLVRVCINLEIRVGCWYTLTPEPGIRNGVRLSDPNMVKKAEPTVLAFDIECTKAPLKFPDEGVDSIFMISYMVDGMGYLIISRHVVGADVRDFEYTPTPKYPGPFEVMNELTEEGLIRRFLEEFRRHGRQIVVTYNGDPNPSYVLILAVRCSKNLLNKSYLGT